MKSRLFPSLEKADAYFAERLSATEDCVDRVLQAKAAHDDMWLFIGFTKAFPGRTVQAKAIKSITSEMRTYAWKVTDHYLVMVNKFCPHRYSLWTLVTIRNEQWRKHDFLMFWKWAGISKNSRAAIQFLLPKSAFSEKLRFNRRAVNFRFWHKATLRLSGTFRESRSTINLQRVVRSGCN